MKRTMLVIFFLTGAAFGQAMSHEEEVVRTTYARLTFAARVNDIHDLWREKGQRKQIDPLLFRLRMESGLRFELSKFKTGPLAEIFPQKYGELVTKPRSADGDSLSITTGPMGITSTSASGIETHGESMVAQVTWVPSQNLIENWDIPFGNAYPLTEGFGLYNRYASFTAKVIFEGRSRTYHAMFLFGPQSTLAVDTVANINGGGVARFLTDDAYPGSLIEGGLADHDNSVREWLRGQQTTTGTEGKLNCEPATGHCAIHERDFGKIRPIRYLKPPTQPTSPMGARLVEAGFHPPVNGNFLLQATCASASKVFPVDKFTAIDDQFHLGPETHSITVLKTSKCTYSSGGGKNCDTVCEVTTPVTVFEGGGLTSSACHVGGSNSDTTHATGTATNGGASCSGAGGGSVKACLFCDCSVSVKVVKTPVEITITSDGFWSRTAGIDSNCGTIPDPAKTVAGGGTECDPVTGIGCNTDCNGAIISPSGVGVTPGITRIKVECDPNTSPIIIDLTGDGFFLTDAAHGVKFDIRDDGHPLQLAWTANANNAWLALDRNGNGVINSGDELFGNFTPQPGSDHPNGFAALAVYDDPKNGGNGDGMIDERDRIFAFLKLWIDANHDGICQPGELHTLPELGVYNIGLDYKPSERRDQYGNVFRYRARINAGLPGESAVGRKAYDVFLVAR